MKRFRKRSNRIYAGVYIDNSGFVKMNWHKDKLKRDILRLSVDTSGYDDEFGIKHIYAYEYNPSILTNGLSKDSKNVWRIFRNALKAGNHIEMSDLDNFVATGVARISEYESLDKFTVFVHVSPTHGNVVLSRIGMQIIEDKGDAELIDIELIKKVYDEVTFDEILLRNIMKEHKDSESKIQEVLTSIRNTFESHKDSGRLFEMKSFLPRYIRPAFRDFLKFKSEDDRILYESLDGANVLLYDDFITSGSTIREMIFYLNSINPRNRLTAFALIKQ